LESDLFFAGIRPAINVGISVSRVGGSAQTKAMKSVAGRLRLDLAQYRELEAFSAFASDLDATTRRQLDRGARTVEILKQPQYDPMPMPQEVMSIFSVTNGLIDAVAVSDVREWERGFQAFMASRYPQVADAIGKEKAISKETDATLRRAIEEFTKDFLAAREKRG
jgi:F-type H+/Na+-transporting ATPase subunit alpha